ncbi:hypothetical protein B14911_25245 [Bacillus sp. NRRL B-14911]|nr:hypothetical protein B14911_25245 [Bacillus sp. NRRL B-14911]
MKKMILAAALLLCMVMMSACSSKEAAGIYKDGKWMPSKPIEVVATAGAGGGWDTHSPHGCPDARKGRAY